jgi:hypothetical protein
VRGRHEARLDLRNATSIESWKPVSSAARTNAGRNLAGIGQVPLLDSPFAGRAGMWTGASVPRVLCAAEASAPKHAIPATARRTIIRGTIR